MIRIYCDWNVISNLKKDEFKKIRIFILENKNCLLFPYSSAHFSDLMKSNKPDNSCFFNNDLQTLEWLSNKHLLRWNDKEKKLEILFAKPTEFYEKEKEYFNISISDINFENIFNDLDIAGVNFGEIFKSLFQSIPSFVPITNENSEIMKKMFPNLNNNSSMWELMNDSLSMGQKLLENKDYYKDLRNTTKPHFHLENCEIDLTIQQIEKFLQTEKTGLTFQDYVLSPYKNRKEPVSRYEFYTNAYLMLDMLGFKSDKLPKPTDNMQNIQTDAQHSFYAAHCDFFVTSDKKLAYKSQVLYKQFNISTKIIKPQDISNVILPLIHKHNINEHFLQEAMRLISQDNLIETYPKSEENQTDIFVYELSYFYFNFFNYCILQYQEQNVVVFTFVKRFQNYSNFLYFTETENVIDAICDFFGYQDENEKLEKKRKFVYDNEIVDFTWQFNNGVIKLEKEEHTKRPILKYYVDLLEIAENKI
jgi:hypothetical protein